MWGRFIVKPFGGLGLAPRRLSCGKDVARPLALRAEAAVGGIIRSIVSGKKGGGIVCARLAG